MTPDRFRECLVLLRWSQRDEGWVRMMARGVRPILIELAAWLEALATAHAANPASKLVDGRRRAA